MKCSKSVLLPLAAILAIIGGPASAQPTSEEGITEVSIPDLGIGVTEEIIPDSGIGVTEEVIVTSTEPSTTTQKLTTTPPVTTTPVFTTTTRATTTVKATTAPSTSTTPSTGSPLERGSYGSPCNHNKDCQRENNFECLKGSCHCEEPQVFDLRQQRCVIPLGMECDSSLSNGGESLCPEFAECFLDRCVCKTGYSMHTLTKCKSDVLERKTVLWPRQAKQDNSDKTSCTQTTCDASKGLKCQVGGACECKDSKEIFVEEFGRCLSPSMQKTLKDALSLVTTSDLNLQSFVKLLEKFEETDQMTGASDHYNSPVHQLISLLSGGNDKGSSSAQIAPFSATTYGDDHAAAAQEPVPDSTLPGSGMRGDGNEGGMGSGSLSSPSQQTLFPLNPVANAEESIEPLTYGRDSEETMKKPEVQERQRYLPLDDYQPQSQEPAIVQRQAPHFGNGDQQQHAEGIPLHGYGVIPESTNQFGRGHGDHYHGGLGHHGGYGGLGHHGGYGGLGHHGGYGGLGLGGHYGGLGGHGGFGSPHHLYGHGDPYGLHHYGGHHGGLGGHRGHGGQGIGHDFKHGLGHGIGAGLGHELGHKVGHHVLDPHKGHHPGIGHHHGGGGHHPDPHHGGHHHPPPPPPPKHHGRGILGDLAEFVGRSLKLIDRFLPLAHSINDAIKKTGHKVHHGAATELRDVRYAETGEEELLKEGGILSGFTKFVGTLMRLRSRLESSDDSPLKKVLL